MSEDEDALWRRAMRDVAPVKRERPPPRKPPYPTPPLRAAQKRATAATAAAARSHSVLGGGDPALDRAAGRRVAIERTLDLHGLTQAEAYRRLLRFLPAAAREGVRLVLVITGKGRLHSEGTVRGVLKARFPDWIEAPPLRDVIARAAPARPRDGGAGAFYVFLKTKGAGRSPRP